MALFFSAHLFPNGTPLPLHDMRRLRAMPRRTCVAVVCACAAVGLNLSIATAEDASTTAPKGESKSTKTKVLEAGAAALQTSAPLSGMDVYVVGFHPMKDDPLHQMEAHHFCRQVNEDFAQCALFDGNSKDANLNGIEYIISEKLFETLPPEEKQYWHPHNYEILSGQLIAPGLPAAAEKELMQSKMNSYGKTWHVWNTGGPDHEADKMPLGDPKLAWSFNRDGEADPKLVADRDRRLDVDIQKIKESRKELQIQAKPQEGVDALHGKFPRQTSLIPGVVPKAQ